jgi:cell division septal protein FtsQ
MAKKQNYVYNEHDRNQVSEVLRARKKRKRKKMRRRILFVLVIVLIGLYFVTDISKVQTIDIIGNTRLSKEAITNISGVKEHENINLFVSTGNITDTIKKMPGIKEVKVTKDMSGHITITVTETSLIAFSQIAQEVYIIDEQGNVMKDASEAAKAQIQYCPEVFNMDEERLKEFAKQYSKIPTQVRNQVSDILYVPENADETRCQFNMDDGKILYLRIEDMAKQLAGDRYAKILQDNPNAKYYDFVGDKNVYSW